MQFMAYKAQICETCVNKDEMCYCSPNSVCSDYEPFNTVNDLLLMLNTLKEHESELNKIQQKFRTAVNNLKINDFKQESYESARDLLKSIQYQIDDKAFLKQLSDIVYEKKIQKYPELLKPTYYPEIDTLEISDEEKLWLDKVARKYYASYIRTVKIDGTIYTGIKKEYGLEKGVFYSIEHLEMLKNIGVVERYYNFQCKDCNDSCCMVSETELNNHKRVWKLYKTQKERLLGSNELEILDDLERDGYGLIYVECMDECDTYYEVLNLNDFEKCMENNLINIAYKVVKRPDLTYENL